MTQSIDVIVIFDKAVTIVKAPERNLRGSLFATDCSDFKRYGDFDGSYKNACRQPLEV